MNKKEMSERMRKLVQIRWMKERPETVTIRVHKQVAERLKEVAKQKEVKVIALASEILSKALN